MKINLALSLLVVVASSAPQNGTKILEEAHSDKGFDVYALPKAKLKLGNFAENDPNVKGVKKSVDFKGWQNLLWLPWLLMQLIFMCLLIYYAIAIFTDKKARNKDNLSLVMPFIICLAYLVTIGLFWNVTVKGFAE